MKYRSLLPKMFVSILPIPEFSSFMDLHRQPQMLKSLACLAHFYVTCISHLQSGTDLTMIQLFNMGLCAFCVTENLDTVVQIFCTCIYSLTMRPLYKCIILHLGSFMSSLLAGWMLS